jgi:capsular polysaccharide biosynthesis protein
MINTSKPNAEELDYIKLIKTYFHYKKIIFYCISFGTLTSITIYLNTDPLYQSKVSFHIRKNTMSNNEIQIQNLSHYTYQVLSSSKLKKQVIKELLSPPHLKNAPKNDSALFIDSLEKKIFRKEHYKLEYKKNIFTLSILHQNPSMSIQLREKILDIFQQISNNHNISADKTILQTLTKKNPSPYPDNKNLLKSLFLGIYCGFVLSIILIIGIAEKKQAR